MAGSDILESLVSGYCAAWGEPSETRRQEILEKVWADDATYTDPTVDLAGRHALAEHISRVQQKFPGSRIVRLGPADAHHGLARFAWRSVLPDGRIVKQGIDICEIAADGRLQRIVGFFDLVPADARHTDAG